MRGNPLSRRLFTSVVAIATLVAGGALVPGVIASATPGADPDVEQMDEYSPAMFAQQAQQLPAELIEALDRDVDVTGAEYLAEAAAATQAVIVVESLEDAGVDVLGSRMEGTELVVNVGDDAAAAVVEDAGATAELGEPEPFVLDKPIRTTTDLWDGQAYYWSDDPEDQSGYVCTTGFQGFNDTTGDPEFVTAGHCLEGAEGIVGPVSALVLDAPNSVTGYFDIGAPLVSTRKWGTGAGDVNYDVSRIAVTYPNITPQPGVLTWGYGAGAPGSTPRTYITGQTATIVGATLCVSGMRTGWRCGPIEQVDWDANQFVDENGDPLPDLHVNSIVAQVCALPGDSGGSAIVGTNAVGITSWSTADGGTCDSVDVAGFFPMLSTDGSKATVATAYTDWELEVRPEAPTITTSQGAVNPTTLTGTVPLSARTASNAVTITLDDGSVLSDSSITSGTWTVDISGVAAGLHTFTAVTQYGAYSFSSPVSGYFSKGVSVARLTGSDRWGTSIDIAQEFTAPVPVLYLTTGLNYPDALSSGPAAAHLDGPVMLVQPSGVSQVVLDQIAALQPQRVIVLGGENSVSATSFAQIDDTVFAATGVNAERITGSDRFATSRAIARDAFLDSDTDPGGSTIAYISNGLNFPDALSAGGAAASVDAPVILVNGPASTVPTETIDLLTDLGVTEIVVTGGTNSVSAGIFAQLDAAFGTVIRQTGADRFGTSAAVNAYRFTPTETRALLATGLNYPDALAGSALAGEWGAPLYITLQYCIRSEIYDELVRLQVTEVSLLGNTPSLSADVAALKRC
jgi:putative cell wall-binding protein